MKIKQFMKNNWILIIIILLALFLRTYNLENRQFGTDEDHTIIFSEMAVNGSISEIIATEPHPPGYYIILGTLMKINQTTYFLRIITVIISIIGIILFYNLINLITKNKTLALTTTYLLSINPMHIIYSTHLRSYMIFILLNILSLILLYKFIYEKNNKMSYYLGIIYSLMFYIHFYTVFVIATHFIIILTKIKKIEIKNYIKGMIIFMIAFLIYIPQFIKQFTYTLVKVNLPFIPLTLKQIPYPLYKYILMINLTTVKNELIYLLITIPIFLILLLIGIYKLYKKDKEIFYFITIAFAGLFLLVLITNPLVSLASHGKTTIYYFRYFVFLIPFFCLYLSQGLEIENKIIKYTLIGIVTITWVTIILYYYDISTVIDWGSKIGV